MHKLNVNVRGGTDNVRYCGAERTLADAGRHLPAVRRQKYPSNANFKRINLRANSTFSLTNTELSLDLNDVSTRSRTNSQPEGLNDIRSS